MIAARCLPWLLVVFGSALIAAEPEGAVEKLRYLRAGGKEPALECEFTIVRGGDGRSISSTTHRGQQRLLVSAGYDKADKLLQARVEETAGGVTKSATVRIADGKVVVTRHDGTKQEFELKPNVIVTSAPDWTDTLRLCRYRDRKAGGKQSFPGLWIHPEKPAAALTFTVEAVGLDEISHGGGKLRLERLTITLRGNSRYVAWADERGTMIRLAPLPFKPGSGLVLEGFEKSAAELKPPEGEKSSE